MLQRLIVGGTLSLCAAGGFTYNLVKKFTGRRAPTQFWQAQARCYNDVLRDEYHAEPVSLTTDDGLHLAALLVVRPNARRTVLLCHGHRMQKECLGSFVHIFPNDNLFLFDFRAHGKSEGTTVSFGYHERQDVKAAVSFVRSDERVKHQPLVGVGISMGAVTLLGAAADGAEFDALIVDSSFAKLDYQIARFCTRKVNLPSGPIISLSLKLYEQIAHFKIADVNPLVYAQQLRVPTFVIHADDDKVVPMVHAQQLYDQLPVHKDMWRVADAKHARIYTSRPETYRQRVEAFLHSIAL